MRALRGLHIYRGWWIVVTGYFTQLAGTGAGGWVFGVLILPMQDDLGWSRSTIVGVLTLQRLVGGAFGAWVGPLVDRHGARVLMTASALTAGSCLMSLSLVHAPWQTYLIWGVFGLTLPGLSTLGPVAAISNWFVRRRTPAIMAYTFGSATAGLVLAPIMATVASEMGWRAAWLIMGIALWSIAPLAWLAVRRRPEDVGLNPDGAASPPTPSLDSGSSRADEQEPSWTVERALRSRSFWLLTLGFMLTMLPASSIFIHMSAYVQSKGFSVEAGAAAVSVYGFGAVLGRFVWGFTVSRLGLHRSLISFGLLYGVSILLYTLPTSLVAIYATTILLGIAIAGSLQLRAQSFPDYFGRRIVGSLVGYATVVGTIAGAAAPLIVALAFDQTGSYAATYVVFGVCCLAASLGFAFSKPRQPESIAYSTASSLRA